MPSGHRFHIRQKNINLVKVLTPADRLCFDCLLPNCTGGIGGCPWDIANAAARRRRNAYKIASARRRRARRLSISTERRQK